MSENKPISPSAPPIIRVVVVDDSAFARKVVREILSTSPFVEVVGTARDGEEALQMTEELKPDIVICDLVMPGLDGVGFVRKQMAKCPLPVLILSSATGDAEEVIDALAAGAVDVVQKPSALATEDLRNVRDELVDKLKASVRAPLENLKREPLRSPPRTPAAKRHSKADVVVLGISTGGPQALRYMMPLFPGDLPVPMAIVLHMPVGYTALFAEKLNEVCALEVKEARDGDALLPGRALLAPAGQHLKFRRNAAGAVVAQLDLQPIEKIHRPSVDVLFRSAAEVFEGRVLAVVMTGMGDDGKEGAAWIKAQGGSVISEAEKSCVIYGMPRSIVEAGLSDLSVPLEKMAQAIVSHL